MAYGKKKGMKRAALRQANTVLMPRNFRKSQGQEDWSPKKYLSGPSLRLPRRKKSRGRPAYKEGRSIDIKAVSDHEPHRGSAMPKASSKERTKKTLREKADKAGLTYGELAKVYRKGRGHTCQW